MRVKLCNLIDMKLHKLFILLIAALAGAAVYRMKQEATESDAYHSLTGEGSLMQTVRAARRSGDESDSSIPMRSRSDHAPHLPPDDLPLIDAAARGDKAKIEERLAMHVKIDSRDILRRTPLMYAAWNGHDDIIARLLAAGADPDAKDRGGSNAFDYAAGHGLAGTVKFMMAHSHSHDTHHYMEYAHLIQAAYSGDLAQLPPESETAASINRVNPQGESPLIIAAGNGATALARELVRRGAQVNTANDEGQTPLHWAAWNNQAKMVEFLLASGASIEQGDLGGNTPLILAAENNSGDAAKILVAHGADKYTANKDGKTAGIIAEDKGYKELAELLQ
ncbi:MAG: ankyrin repeat domain-containing protein [Pseudomonadota bacterium]|nr:ankyrin repeat domain-containing protein [Pseudomonadota bacterium]